MRVSDYHLVTLRETPADAEIVSHQLMVRTGMIRRLAGGIYTWSPLGLRVLRRVEQVVREEMDRAGALEMLMPAVQPAELWEETDRWATFGPLLLKIRDRAEREYCFGPTHEEVITDFARNEIKSYRQLPLTLYQIQTKFRDEIRPRFGVMRAREFLMKDAYSFHIDEDDQQRTYWRMYRAYQRMLERLGLDYRAVQADSGAIGGSTSHEFHVLASSGEDEIAFATDSDYAANVELAAALAPADERPAPQRELERVATPGQYTIEAVSDYLDVPASRTVKTLIAEDADKRLFALVVRGDQELNELKAAKLETIAQPFEWAGAERIRAATGAAPGSVGPVGLDIPVIVDRAAYHLSDFVCGANSDDYHCVGVNWDRDVTPTAVADLRNVVEGDPSPDGQGKLKIVRGIEVGHVFQLGTKYSEAMGATVLDENGRAVPMAMGCYGVGVSRIVAAAIEQNHDERGIIWPDPIAPFQIALCPVNYGKSQRVREAADRLYDELTEAGYEVLYDDRGARPGVMFADMELIGIPHRIVVGERGLDSGTLEYRHRRAEASEDIPLDGVLEALGERLSG